MIHNCTLRTRCLAADHFGCSNHSLINSNNSTTINIIVEHIRQMVNSEETQKGSTVEDPIVFSLAVDATKLAEGLQVDTTSMAIVGGCN